MKPVLIVLLVFLLGFSGFFWLFLTWQHHEDTTVVYFRESEAASSPHPAHATPHKPASNPFLHPVNTKKVLQRRQVTWDEIRDRLANETSEGGNETASSNATAGANETASNATTSGNETVSNATTSGNMTASNATTSGNMTASNATTSGNMTASNATTSGNMTASNATEGGNMTTNGTSSGMRNETEIGMIPSILVLAVANDSIIAGHYFYDMGQSVYFESRANESFILRRNGDDIAFLDVRRDNNTNNITVILNGTVLTNRSELFDLLDQRDNLRLVRELLAISYELGILGYDGRAFPSALPLHLAAANLRYWLLMGNNSNFDNSTMRGDVTSIFYTDASRRLCTREPEGNSCTGLCGRNCECWEFVCGDCCWHQGCFDHDNCCTRDPTSFACLFPFRFRCDRPFEC